MIKVVPLSAKSAAKMAQSPEEGARSTEQLRKLCEGSRPKFVECYIHGLVFKDDTAMEKFFGKGFLQYKEYRRFLLGDAMLGVQDIVESGN